MYMADLLSVFKKCYNALAPNGKLVVFDYQKAILDKLIIENDDNLGSAVKLTILMKKAGYRSVRDLSFLSHDSKFLINDGLDFSISKLLSLTSRFCLTHIRKTQWLVLEAQK